MTAKMHRQVNEYRAQAQEIIIKHDLRGKKNDYLGDAVIRLWLRQRIAYDFGGKSGRPIEDLLNSNQYMKMFANDIFKDLQGKAIADEFESVVGTMMIRKLDYSSILELYYQCMLTATKSANRNLGIPVWHGVEFKCPALRSLKKAHVI